MSGAWQAIATRPSEAGDWPEMDKRGNAEAAALADFTPPPSGYTSQVAVYRATLWLDVLRTYP